MTNLPEKVKVKLPSLKSLYDGDLELKGTQNKLNIVSIMPYKSDEQIQKDDDYDNRMFTIN